MREGETDQNILHAKKSPFNLKRNIFRLLLLVLLAGPCYVVQDSFEVVIILSLPPKSWDDRCGSLNENGFLLVLSCLGRVGRHGLVGRTKFLDVGFQV